MEQTLPQHKEVASFSKICVFEGATKSTVLALFSVVV